MTSNQSPATLFGDHLAMIQERYMIANIDGVPLFPLINYIRNVHDLPQYEAPAEHPVANININFYFVFKTKNLSVIICEKHNFLICFRCQTGNFS